MRENNNKEMEIDLLELAKVLWKRVWVIVLSVVILGAVAAIYSTQMITPMYKASTSLYVSNNSGATNGNGNITSADISASQSLVDTYIAILQSRRTLGEVIEKANLDYSYEELKEMVSAQSINGVEILNIDVVSAKPWEATTIANTIGEVLPEQIGSIIEGSSVKVVDHAVTPYDKCSPNNLKNTAIGMMLGFVLSCAYIILKELLDDNIKNEEYLLQNYDIPVLAVIPDLNNQKSGNNYYYAQPSRHFNQNSKGKRTRKENR